MDMDMDMLHVHADVHVHVHVRMCMCACACAHRRSEHVHLAQRRLEGRAVVAPEGRRRHEGAIICAICAISSICAIFTICSISELGRRRVRLRRGCARLRGARARDVGAVQLP